MSQNIVAKTGIWILIDSNILITARGNEVLAWGAIEDSSKANKTLGMTTVTITEQPLRSRIFKHLEHPDTPNADELPMRGLIALAREFMQEILLKKELKEI